MALENALMQKLTFQSAGYKLDLENACVLYISNFIDVYSVYKIELCVSVMAMWLFLC